MRPAVVIDTNVLLSACLKADTAPRQLIRLSLEGKIQPLVSAALYSEYLDVLGREKLFENSPLSSQERNRLLDAFLSCCKWVSIYYLWRPNLPDEGDNHLIELAVAGNAKYLATGNKKHFVNTELHFPRIKIVNCSEFLQLEQY